ncbi:hypothetical protein HAX54_001660, partial [Datura stramonium]|nr:hypothetical protein [Datura stramonium]
MASLDLSSGKLSLFNPLWLLRHHATQLHKNNHSLTPIYASGLYHSLNLTLYQSSSFNKYGLNNEIFGGKGSKKKE